MRVLYLTYTPFSGRASTTVATEGWFQCLRPKGLSPIVVSHHAGFFHDWASTQGVPCYEVVLPHPNKRWPIPFLRSLWRLVWIARKHHVQLVHCNEQISYPIGRYVSRICRLPIVVSVHSLMNRGFCEWAFGGRRQPDRLLFISPGSRDACRPGVEGVVDQNRWRVVTNGLDLSRFARDEQLGRKFRQQYGLGSGPIIGVACALREGKQLDHLFAAAAKLKNKDVRVVLAGGPVPIEKDFAPMILSRGKSLLGDRFTTLGHLEQLDGFYNALDLFVNTSREEACSISVLEALACGCPIVGYPSKSVAGQVLPDGGEIVPQDDVEQLTDALERWLSDPQKMERARKGARHRVEADFDINKISDQLWNEYESLVGQYPSADR